jgi:hypothetical protein
LLGRTLSVRITSICEYQHSSRQNTGKHEPCAVLFIVTLRLLNDQSLENATGVGAPPWTWPRDEQVIDLLHKGIYAFVTGAVADLLIAGPPRSPVQREGWTVGEPA